MCHVPHGINLYGNTASSEPSISIVAPHRQCCCESLSIPFPEQKCWGGGNCWHPWACGLSFCLCQLWEVLQSLWAEPCIPQLLPIAFTQDTCRVVNWEQGLSLAVAFEDYLMRHLCSFAHLFDVLKYNSDPEGYYPTNIHPSESLGFFVFELWKFTHLA